MHQIKKRIIYALCCLFIGGSLSAQDKTNYFVYIQNEKSQPFYLKYKGQVLSSSPKGYIILPKMEQGDAVPVTVGFPKNEYPEQSFLIKVNRRDQGLLLKNTGEEGFALYDLQTFNITKAGEGLMAKEKDPVAAEVAAGNAEALQGAGAGDTTAAEVAQAPVAEEPKKAEAPTPPKPKGAFAAALDRVVVDGRDDKIPEEKPEMVVAPVKEAPVLAPTEKLTKKQQRKAKRKAASLSDEEQEILTAVLDDERKQAETEAAEGVVADEKKAAAEEVVVEEVARMPEERPAPKKEKKAKKKSDKDPEFIEFAEEGAAAVPVVTEAATSEKKPSARDLKRQKRKEARENADTDSSMAVVAEEKPAEREAAEPKRMVNSDCAKIMEVNDFRKLMRKMSGQKKEYDMLDVFRKGVRGVCVSTDQVRSLVQLLDEESNRYELLDIAYPKTYDAENFAGLQGLLKQDYYQDRFKAMIRRK